MIKYYMVAAGLKGASCCSVSRNVYRAVGNHLGQKKRLSHEIPGYYFERVKRNITLIQRHNLLPPGSRLLEMGTGWMHWEALTTRLFHDFSAMLYDVWDNRQFEAMKRYLRGLAKALRERKIDVPGDTDKALKRIEEIERLKTFDELYHLLDFEYVLDPQGEMKTLPDGAFSVIISAGVLEHVHLDSVPKCIQSMSRILKPGAHCIHSINITDHLYLYDRTASPKQYLGHSERMWKLCFENVVQYINRLQRGEWLKMYEDAGFELIGEDSVFHDINGLAVSPKYAGMAVRDLECLTLNIVLRKK